MEAKIYNQQADVQRTLELPARIFDVAVRPDVMLQVAQAQLANQRQPIAHTKGRGDVRGGGKKPWRQKGTGRARHGSIRSPLWKGGGVTFGPTNEKNYTKKVNVKMARKALAMALAGKAKTGQLAVIDKLVLTSRKTKEMSAILRVLSGILSGASSQAKSALPSTLVITPSHKESEALMRSVSNLPRVEIIEARNVNALMILSFQNVMLMQDAIPVLEGIVAK